MRTFRAALVAGALSAAMAAATPDQTRGATTERSCRDLAALRLPQVTIRTAEVVAAGAFAPPGRGGAAGRAFAALPTFCRVTATLTPSSDSDVTIEVWMPVQGWNGKFQAVGNGAFTGSIAYPAMSNALARGYATASTDTGHLGNTAEFGLGHPEKVIDFGWRAVHEMTATAKQLVANHYGTGPRFSYWNGCSAGGRQGMKEAQRFPADYDGIIAGAPGLDWTGRAAQAVYAAGALQRDEASRIPASKREVIHQAVLATCDARDGVEDGIVDSPERCAFDPGALLCRGQDGPACLTASQVETARMLYASQTSARAGRTTGGLLPGSELGWTDLGWTASARATGLDQFRYLVFQDPAWEASRFSFDADLARADEIDAGLLNALDSDLSTFFGRGGKLIQYHGWSDPQISPLNSTDYFRRVLDTLGGAESVDQSYRLFMAPGMGHCGSGEGPNQFDMVAALEEWVEHGAAPDRIVASRVEQGRVIRTRPLCPYPTVARYKGSGSPDEAINFVCATNEGSR
jgi:feruloyl esterase